ncbi:hypothetical protein V493_00358 [Pseudogymnoascus sp. VKM F-4281 (FW-2241)]|nr:hypothetical protein V493_00358 [Pseudogymnoascus sp. VKM F-4281 (FW-2241)]
MASSTLGELNRSYWKYPLLFPSFLFPPLSRILLTLDSTNADAAFNQKWVQTLVHQITDYIQTHVGWIGVAPATSNAPVTMLDYACGNGVASRVSRTTRSGCDPTNSDEALAPYVTTIRGIDVSDVMVKKYNDAARMQSLSEQQMHAVQGDLLVPPGKAPEALKTEDLYDFDVIVMSMALHHVEDPQQMTTRLVERLRDGGSILIIDWAPGPSGGQDMLHQNHHQTHSTYQHEHDGGHQQDMQGAKQTVSRSGFDKKEMDKILKDAGCSEVDYVFHPQLSKLPSEFGGEKQLFFARGKK